MTIFISDTIYSKMAEGTKMIKNIKPIMVTGAYTSNKDVLISLLDSPDILCFSQWHDALIDIFYNYCAWFNKANETERKNKKIIKLRKMLSKQSFPALEQFALEKKISFPVSLNEAKAFEFDFDYYNQTKEFFESVYNLSPEDINVQNLLNLFFETFVKNFKNLPNNNYEYFASASEAGFFEFEKLISAMPEIKIIYIRKPTWFLSYANELAAKGINYLETIFNDEKFVKIRTAEQICKNIEERYPNNFKVIEFKDLASNYSEVMDFVVDFIGLKKEEIYKTPSFLTNKIKLIDKQNNLNLLPVQITQLEREYSNQANVPNLNIAQKELQTYLKQDSDEFQTIKTNEISVVIQGNIGNKKELKENIKRIRKILPDSQIVLSTWESCDTQNIDYDELVLNKDPGSNDIKPTSLKANNCNRQITSTLNGIKKATRKYVLKLRTDCRLENANFLKYANSKTLNSLKRVNEYSVFQKRILTDSCFTRDSEQAQLNLCFHPSDIWLFGLKTDLEDLFDIPLQQKFIATNCDGVYHSYRFPEQYIWTSCLEKHGWYIFMETGWYNNPHTNEYSLKSIINNYFVLNNKKSGIKLPKKFKKYPKRYYKYVITTRRYFDLYQAFCDGNYKIPKEFKYGTLAQALGIEKYLDELMPLLQPFEVIITIPKYILRIAFKTILNFYKIWWLK